MLTYISTFLFISLHSIGVYVRLYNLETDVIQFSKLALSGRNRGNDVKELDMPDRLVYSTDGGRVTHCPICGQPYKHCRCDQFASETPTKKSDGIVRITRDRKHRGGKTVPVISGVPTSRDTLTT